MKTNILGTIEEISKTQATQVQGAKSIPTLDRLRPLKASPVVPKEPIFITMAINEDGGHWKSL